MAKPNYDSIAPKSVGDAYLLVGYPKHDMATLAFAIWDGEWSLAVAENEYFWFSNQRALDLIPADDVLLLRRVHEGLRQLIPSEWRESALRYEETPKEVAL